MRVVISYSRKDKKLKDKFVKHLNPLSGKYGMSIWDDTKILAGEAWENTIWHEINRSQLIIVLISVEFLNSDFCMTKEFKAAIERHKNGESILVPVILEDCAWQAIDGLSSIQVLPGHNKTIKRGFRSHDQALSEAILLIEKLIKNYRPKITKHRRKSVLAAPNLDDYKDSKYKAVFFDLDGTLVRGKPGFENFRYSWQLVWSYLGFCDTVRKDYYRQYVDKKISYQEWCDVSKDLFHKKGLKKSDFNKIASQVRLTKNCKQTLSILKERGFILTLVSGSINTFLEAVFPDCYEYFDNVFINKFHYDHRGIIESISTTEYDFEGKYKAIVDVCREENISLEACVFVGEGHNDVYAAKTLIEAGGLSIGYPSDLLHNFVHHGVNKDGLQAILDLIFNEQPMVQNRLKFDDNF